ncbi:hypothetical protein [Corynebacterium occultum]|nr:hypothetical protein [Corynebacterium occultum]
MLHRQEDFSPAQEEELIEKLRASGPGVHRVVLTSRPGTFTVDLRPMEDRGSEIIMDAAGTPDQRQHPHQPGGDRGWILTQLSRIRRGGAGDSVLLDESGQIISTITAPLVLLEGANVHVSDHPLLTPSLMLDEVVAHLLEHGLQLIHYPAGFTMPPLRRGEVWVLNPLSGLCKVSGWLEYGSIVTPRPLPQRIPPTHLEVEAWRWEQATDLS